MANFTERTGVHYCGLIAEQNSWMFREQTVDDVGIDAHMEYLAPSGKTKQLLALQIKSGASWFKEQKDGFVIFRRISKRQYIYWTTNPLPCIVVLYNPDDGMCIWQKLTGETIEKTNGGDGQGYFVKVPLSQIFIDAFSNEKLLSFIKLPQIPSTSDELSLNNREDTTLFTRDMTINFLKKHIDGVLKIPEGISVLSGDFALVFDWIPEQRFEGSFRELIISSTVETINGILLTEYGPDLAPIKRFKKITVSPDNPYFMSIDGVLFTKDIKKLICYPCGKIGKHYIVPDTVEVIGERAFCNNVHLETIVLPKTLKRIECQAFFQCDKLTNLDLPEGLLFIGEECFELSIRINRLRIPSSINKIYTSVFSCGIVIEIPDELSEFEYDYVPTEWLNMPYSGPAILCKNNDMIIDFAESYDYNYFVGYKEDSDGIIWSEDGKTLICFPSKWKNEHYILPENVRYVYLKAFESTTVTKFSSKSKIIIVGRDTDMPRYFEPLSGYNFSIKFGGKIYCEDQKDTDS